MNQIVEDIARVIKTRSDNDEDFGICLIPEGLIEFVPEIKKLIAEINACWPIKPRRLMPWKLMIKIPVRE